MRLLIFSGVVLAVALSRFVLAEPATTAVPTLAYGNDEALADRVEKLEREVQSLRTSVQSMAAAFNKLSDEQASSQWRKMERGGHSFYVVPLRSSAPGSVTDLQ